MINTALIQKFLDRDWYWPEKVEIGEFALSYDWDEDDTENIEFEFKALGLRYLEELEFYTPSSKSGTVFSAKSPVPSDIEDIQREYEELISVAQDETSGIKEVARSIKRLNAIANVFDRSMRRLAREEEKVRALVRRYAIGERSGCFSNGEVVFRPINQKRTGYRQSFTPYYNPNEA